MTLQEAKELMTKEDCEHLREITTVKPEIDFSHKVNNDILMTALCKAVAEETIQPISLNDRIVKLLNSETNTISQTKLEEILKIIHKNQPKMYCCITLYDANMTPRYEWDLYDNISFLPIFDYVVKLYEITPTTVRHHMTQTLKPTIVNNVSQLVSKYHKSTEEERNKMMISITTIQRLVNMSGDILFAEFYEKA